MEPRTAHDPLRPLLSWSFLHGVVGVHVVQHGAVSRVRQAKRVSRSAAGRFDAFRDRASLIKAILGAVSVIC